MLEINRDTIGTKKLVVIRRPGSVNGLTLIWYPKKWKLSFKYQRRGTKTGPYLAIVIGPLAIALAWGRKPEDYKNDKRH